MAAVAAACKDNSCKRYSACTNSVNLTLEVPSFSMNVKDQEMDEEAVPDTSISTTSLFHHPSPVMDWIYLALVFQQYSSSTD